MSSYKEVFQNNLFNWCEFEAKIYSNVYLIDHTNFKSFLFDKDGRKKFKNRNDYLSSTKHKNMYVALKSNGYQMFVEKVVNDMENNKFLGDSITNEELTQCFKKAFDND
jgi:hypothetical protein